MNAISLAQSLVLKSVPTRKKRQRIKYKDENGNKTDLETLMEKYDVCYNTIKRAFIKHECDHVKANAELHEKYIVPIVDRVPSHYTIKDYRDQEGNPIERKEAAAILGITPIYTSYLYDRFDNDWKYIYDNHGKTKIKGDL